MRLSPPGRFPAAVRYLTEHCGWKVQIALCIERQPTKYRESEIETVYRAFVESWCHKTKNRLKIPRLATIESKITHKVVPSKEDTIKVQLSQEEDKEEPTGELEALLASEIKLTPKRRTSKATQETKDVTSQINVDGDIRNIERHATDWLFLTLKYRDIGWTLPKADLHHGDGLRQTLQRICEEQFSDSYRPYFLGYAPFFHRSVAFRQENPSSDILGNKVFYFRARHIPGSLFNIHPGSTDIVDYAWCTIQELESKLGDRTLIRSLPLINNEAAKEVGNKPGDAGIGGPSGGSPI